MAELIVCNSRYTASMFGKSAELLHDSTPAPKHPLPTLALSGTEPIKVAYVGRLSERKGIHVIPLALAACGSRHRFHFIFVGDCKRGDEQLLTQVTTSLKILDNVSCEFVGHRADPGAVVRECHFAIAPSILPETFGLVLVEALKLGVPVVASNLGAYQELICSGSNGFLFPPGDADALARILETISAMPDSDYQEMRASAAISAQPYFLESYRTNAARIMRNVVDKHC